MWPNTTEESVSPPTPAAVNYLHILLEGWDLASPSSHHDRTLTALILCWSCAWNHSCCEFNRTVALSCIEDRTAQYQALSSDSYNSFVPSSAIVSELWRWRYSVPFMAEHSVVTYARNLWFLNFLQKKKWGCYLHHRNVRVSCKVSPSRRFVGHWLWVGCWGEQCGFHDEKDAAPKL